MGPAGSLNGVSCISAGSCVAVGQDSNNQPVFVTDINGTWGPITEVNNIAAGGTFRSVSCTSPGNCVSVGVDADTTEQPIYSTLTTVATGYWLVASDGGIFNYGFNAFFGSHGGAHLNQPIVAMAATPDGQGYWLAASDGGIFTYGDAIFFGSHGRARLNQPIVGMAATPDGRVTGWWPATAVSPPTGTQTSSAPRWSATQPTHRGHGRHPRRPGLLAGGQRWRHLHLRRCGLLRLHGGAHLNQPIVGMAATPDGQGYWLVARDGGIFTYGDAGFFGSHGGAHLNQPIVGMAANLDGQGYWLVASDGGIFSYGSSPTWGLTVGRTSTNPSWVWPPGSNSAGAQF